MIPYLHNQIHLTHNTNITLLINSPAPTLSLPHHFPTPAFFSFSAASSISLHSPHRDPNNLCFHVLCATHLALCSRTTGSASVLPALSSAQAVRWYQQFRDLYVVTGWPQDCSTVVYSHIFCGGGRGGWIVDRVEINREAEGQARSFDDSC